MSEKCRGCGAELIYDVGSQSLKCVYCGSTYAADAQKNILPSRATHIIPLAVSPEALKLRVYQFIANDQRTSDDMMVSVILTKCDCFYVPTYSFDVGYNVRWSASFSTTVPGSTDLATWQSAGGDISGKTTITAYAGSELDSSNLLPKGLVSKALSKGNFTEFSLPYIQGARTENFCVSEADAFASLHDSINKFLDDEVKDRKRGGAQKDWKWKTVEPLQHNVTTVYVPICHAVLAYQGKEYNVWMDGTGTGEIRADTLPTGQEIKKSNARNGTIFWATIATMIVNYIIWHSFLWSELIPLVIFIAYSDKLDNRNVQYSQYRRNLFLNKLKESTPIPDSSEEKLRLWTLTLQETAIPKPANPLTDVLTFEICVLMIIWTSIPGLWANL